MKVPKQSKNAYDPDIASFKTLVRSSACSKRLTKRPIQAAKRYDTDMIQFVRFMKKLDL